MRRTACGNAVSNSAGDILGYRRRRISGPVSGRISDLFRRPFTTALLLLPLLAGGCWSSSSTPPEEEGPKEIELAQKPKKDGTPDEIFEAAKRTYRARLFTVAKDSFEVLRDSYPLGPYGEYAELKVADCTFLSNEFTTAAGLFEEFAKNHPGSPSAPYAAWMAARSYHRSNRGVGRDRVSLEKSLDLLNKFLTQFPTAPFEPAVRVERDEVMHKLAAYDKMILDFYEKKNLSDALVARNNQFKRTWGDTLDRAPLQISESEKVKKQMVLASSKPSNPVSASPSAALPAASAERPVRLIMSDAIDPPRVLSVARGYAGRSSNSISRPIPVETARASFADSAVARDIGSAGPVPPSPRSERTAFASEALPSRSGQGRARTVTRIGCDSDPRKRVTIWLSRPLDEGSADSSITSQAGSLRFRIPAAQAHPHHLNCFGEHDLSISDQGEVVLEHDGTAEAVTLVNPPRVVLFVED